MDLLLEIKRFYTVLKTAGAIKEMPTREELEKVADKCYDEGYDLMSEVPMVLHEQYIQELKELALRARDVIEREKK